MRDLEIVVKALREEADYCRSDPDRITGEIGYRLEQVADRIEKLCQPSDAIHTLDCRPEDQGGCVGHV